MRRRRVSDATKAVPTLTVGVRHGGARVGLSGAVPRGWIPQVENLRPLSGRSSKSGCRFSTCTGSATGPWVPQVKNLRPLSETYGHFGKRAATFGRGCSTLPGPAENAARGCPCPGAGVADKRSHGWRSAVSIERAQPRMGEASVRRWAWVVPSGAAKRDPHRSRDWAS